MLVDTSPKYSGEPTAEALANGLATLGRYGDNYMVHAAEGETVVPREVLESNPGLKEDLFKQMTMMGIENPNRYVVGNELNSINPITGQPEFFFKKVFRAIKRVVKKIAPIAAPIIGNIIAPGIGGIIASGLVTKLQGGSWGDALKSAALSYAGSALTSGIGSALQGTSVGDFIGAGTPAAGSTFGGRFATGLGRGLTTPFTAASNLFSSGAQNPLAQGILGPRGTGTIFSSLGGTQANPSAFAQSGQKGIMGTIMPSYQTSDQLIRQGIIPSSGAQSPNYSAPITAQQLAPPRPVNAQQLSNFQGEAGAIAKQLGPISPGPGAPPGTTMGGSFDQQAYIQARSAGMNVTAARDVGLGLAPPAPTQTIGPPRTIGSRNPVVTQGAASAAPQAKPEASFLGYKGPGAETISKVAGQLAVPAALAGAAYFMTPEVESEAELMAQLDANNPRRVAYDEWQSIQDKNSPEALAKFEQWYGKPAYSASQLASSFGARPLSGITANVASLPAATGIPSGPLGPELGLNLAAAGGGEIVGPGTGTSDSIPAMLSDGEFVMTAKAVRNAGNGNRDLGAARMYDMMNRFERGRA